jgi:hypothetical protein
MMTAKDLLYKILEYKYLLEFQDEYTIESEILGAEIAALQEAFGLSKDCIDPTKRVTCVFRGVQVESTRAFELRDLSDFKYLTGGIFLEDRQVEKNKTFTSKVIKLCKQFDSSKTQDQYQAWAGSPGGIKNIFREFLNFRQQIFNISYTGKKPTGESSVSVLYIGYTKNRFNEVLLNHLDEIDDILWVILDPEKRDLSLDMLRREFKYPDANRMFSDYYRRKVAMGF